jgi:hypothetical protein
METVILMKTLRSLIITITIGVTDSFNLIGNPYPSALDADKFYRKIEECGTIYFWTHITAITLRVDLLQEPQVRDLAYTSNDYARITLLAVWVMIAKKNDKGQMLTQNR